ncbi:MAG TPA: trypsin-like peptidase domain-containing protein [Candidatus Limnocylindrales bacterium]|nr:trypsin-like peptidase domain-containing protein [Candidatus Limnocylindrales bacterium]
MNQPSRVPDPRARILRQTAPGLVGALVLGSLLVAACGPGAVASGVPGPSATPTASAPASPTIAAALQNDFIKVVGSVSPSVVVIETASGLGSGIVFDTNGDIVTNDHVVAGSTTFSVTLAGGAVLPGTLVGTYPAGDLAVIHVTGTGLKPATFGDDTKLVVGDIVLAVGNPLGLQSSVTQGIVSALGRSVPESSTVTLPNVIQTSAEINPGNSGGALVDLAGDVVGIPTLAALDPEFGNTPAAGIGFAIPSSVVVDVAGQLIASGHVVSAPAPSAQPAT